MLAFVLSAVLAQELSETITVYRIIIDARVTEAGGRLITDLGPEDFDVRISRRRMAVESAEWIDESSAVAVPASGRPSEDRLEAGNAPPEPTGRLFVFFVQTDFARNTWNVQGQMNFLPYALQFIDSLPPTDRIAVFSYDSHLKFRLDFTTDRAAARKALESTLRIDYPAFPDAGEPSIGPNLDRAAMRKARDSEAALLVLGKALRPIPGPKSILLLGWGLGEKTKLGLRMSWRWKDARPALTAARASVFAIDTVYANSHDLEKGLMIAAEETGGTFMRSFEFPDQTVALLKHTLRGRYEITLRSPVGFSPGEHDLEIRTTRPGAIVLAASTIVMHE